MNAPAKITASLDAETFAMVERLATAQGRSTEEFAAEAIRRVAETDTDLQAFLKIGEDAIARGDYMTHDELVADISRWKEQRSAHT